MPTYHIHISGLVQGVGFRPYVYRIAKEMCLKGWVANTTTGVHIVATTEEETFRKFYHKVIHHPPANAQIISHLAALISPQQFNDFYIQQSTGDKVPDLLMTPDFGLCADCKRDLFDPKSRRYRYPFVTCTQCGPRYSIITALPYDRDKTTMAPYEQCWQCRDEYHNPENRRYYSQTNSCADCGIPMYLYNSDGVCICKEYECILLMVQDILSKGHVVAVKGIGGYLLLCDATNRLSIANLRERKHRPAKPFALLYPDAETAEKDVLLQACEKEALQSVAAPIVLCTLKEEVETGIATDLIAPRLAKIGVMLPYSPLLALIATSFGKPLIATSGNVSGSPILFTDVEALDGLSNIADFFLTYDRDVVIPQDDSVIQFTKKHQQKIILRCSRGMAPNYFSPPFDDDLTALAMGADLKSSFALLDNNRCYVSQYLGNQSAFEAQQSFSHTLQHLTSILRFEPEMVIVDKHPDYFVSQAGKELARKHHLPLYEVQHHQAHFAAVLAENNLLESNEPILGVIWDGTGYGDEKHSWGGEAFLFAEGKIKRMAHLDDFTVIAGDKMAKEPRLSALSLLQNTADAQVLLRDKFSAQEWNYYQRLLAKEEAVKTSSMGRLLDGIASLLNVCNRSSYEGEAAMQLEALAATCREAITSGYSFYIEKNLVHWQPMLKEILSDVSDGVEKSLIALKVHRTLADMVKALAQKTGVTRIAFSGGVMQNALLVDLLIESLDGYELFFHQQLSPNDECIAFGQLACLAIVENLAVTLEDNIEMLT
jgi:hydrogenase maturation protein HypF